MTWNDQPVQPAPLAPAATAPSGRSGLSPARRGVATLLLALGLLAVGGGAVAFAADPSASPDPAATTQPSTGTGGSTAPSTGRTHGDCPNKAGTGSGSGSGPDSSAAPSTDQPTTAPSAEL